MINRDNFDVLPPNSFKPEYPSWQKHYCALQAELVKLSEVVLVAEAVEKVYSDTRTSLILVSTNNTHGV
jgi:hypothetical protein